MGLAWVAIVARTGQVIADMPDLVVSGALKRTLGRYETLSASLPLPTAPSDWLNATIPGAVVLVCLDDSSGVEVPVWGGLIVTRNRSASDLVELSMVTVEGYFDRRYVGNQTYTGQGQNDICADLINRYVRDGAGGRAGLPIVNRYATPGSGAGRARTFFDADDATVYSRLVQLMGVLGGPEWTVDWESFTASGQRRYRPVFTVGDRIGNAPADGYGPAATFEIPGPITDVTLFEDYSTGKGANAVMAVSSGQGDARPSSGYLSPGNLSGRPTFEYRWTPGTSITSTAVLQDHAVRALQLLGPGASVLTLSANVVDAPVLGRDWYLGDDVGYSISDTVPAFPGGLNGVGRCIGWELTDTTINPILAVTGLASEGTP